MLKNMLFVVVFLCGAKEVMACEYGNGRSNNVPVSLSTISSVNGSIIKKERLYLSIQPPVNACSKSRKEAVFVVLFNRGFIPINIYEIFINNNNGISLSYSVIANKKK